MIRDMKHAGSGRSRNRKSRVDNTSFITPQRALTAAGLIGLLTTVVLSRPPNTLSQHLTNEPKIGVSVRDAFLEEYAPTIIEESAKYDNISPELVAGVISTENFGRKYANDLNDIAAVTIGKDASVGPMQIRASTARSLDKKVGSVKGDIGYYLDLLSSDPKANISYGMKYLSTIAQNAFPGKSAEWLLANPKALAYVASVYTTGERPGQNVNCEGNFTLANIARGFPKPLEVTGTDREFYISRRSMAEYLERDAVKIAKKHCPRDIPYIRESAGIARNRENR